MNDSLQTRRIQDLVDGSMDAIISVDEHMRIVLFNQAAAQMFGVTSDGALGRPIDQFIPARFREAHAGHVAAFGVGQHPRRSMGRGGMVAGLRANGEEFPAVASISHSELDGRPLFTVFLRDAMQEVHARHALEHSRADLQLNSELLERTAAMAKVGGWELDLTTFVVTYSKETARIHEVDYPYVPPKLSQGNEYYPPQAWPTVEAAVKQAIEFGTPYELETPFITAKGRHIWVRVQGFAVQEGGKTTKLQGTFQDITERVYAEEEKRAMADRLALATRAGGIGIWDLDVPTNTLIWDDAMYALYGASADQFAGAYEAWKACVHADDQARVEAEVQASLYEGKDFDTEFRVRWPHGEIRTMRSLASVQRGAQGEPVRIVGTNWDNTAQKASEEALRTSLKEKDALLKEVHHRVKNNLQVITSLLRMEARRSAVPESVHVLKDMQGRIQSMALLHESLYRTGTFASVDLGAYLGRIATQALQSHQTGDSVAKLSLHMGSVGVGMDQAMACGLLVNELVSNCSKHAFPPDFALTKGAEVRVDLIPVNAATVDADAMWCLRVSDNGAGLPADFEERRKRSLGLQLVSDLTQQAGGILDIGNHAAGGAAFAITFKAQAPAALVVP
ncbi:PAS domain-containing protein [Rhodoferax aquaticus]|uniref:PAS domain S-box protein n=1 Tax=Rhodoferax aquaticus TaxID=2527691 RepID=A0A515EK60_9BURK|nr:PAS domain-containing protein [Rhodoferax aquaticus]QDL52979.1 PAS domain S-box protein [Rhodoferax aquaticus]